MSRYIKRSFIKHQTVHRSLFKFNVLAWNCDKMLNFWYMLCYLLAMRVKVFFILFFFVYLSTHGQVIFFFCLFRFHFKAETWKNVACSNWRHAYVAGRYRSTPSWLHQLKPKLSLYVLNSFASYTYSCVSGGNWLIRYYLSELSILTLV